MSQERFTKYEPTQIPRQIVRKMYVHYRAAGFNAGAVSVWDFDNTSDPDAVIIHTFTAKINIPEIDRDGLKSKVLEKLNGEKQRIMAENTMKLKIVQDKIDNLLAIEYKSERVI